MNDSIQTSGPTTTKKQKKNLKKPVQCWTREKVFADNLTNISPRFQEYYRDRQLCCQFLWPTTIMYQI